LTSCLTSPKPTIAKTHHSHHPPMSTKFQLGLQNIQLLEFCSKTKTAFLVVHVLHRIIHLCFWLQRWHWSVEDNLVKEEIFCCQI
jgi:hypothetical protein